MMENTQGKYAIGRRVAAGKGKMGERTLLVSQQVRTERGCKVNYNKGKNTWIMEEIERKGRIKVLKQDVNMTGENQMEEEGRIK